MGHAASCMLWPCATLQKERRQACTSAVASAYNPLFLQSLSAEQQQWMELCKTGDLDGLHSVEHYVQCVLEVNWPRKRATSSAVAILERGLNQREQHGRQTVSKMLLVVRMHRFHHTNTEMPKVPLHGSLDYAWMAWIKACTSRAWMMRLHAQGKWQIFDTTHDSKITPVLWTEPL